MPHRRERLPRAVERDQPIAVGAHGRRHLVYLRRSRVDVFQGTFGGLVRRMVNKRVTAEGGAVLESLRLKLEGGLPLSAGASAVR